MEPERGENAKRKGGECDGRDGGKKGCAQGSFGPSYIHSFLDLSSFLSVPDAHGDEHDSWLNEMEPKALSTFGQIKNKMYWTHPYSKS